MHSGESLIFLADCRNIGEVQLWIYTVGEHIHGKCNDIYITCSLTITKQCTFDTVSTCQQSQFCITDTASSVIMGMQAQSHCFTIFQILADIFYLGCKYMRHCNLYCGRNIDNNLILRLRLPYIKNCIAHLYGIVYFCSGEALRAVLKREITLCFRCQFIQKLRSINRNLLNLFLTFLEYLLTLCYGC